MSSLICKWKEHNDPFTVHKYLKKIVERGQTSRPGVSAVHSTVAVSHTNITLLAGKFDAVVNAVSDREVADVVFSFCTCNFSLVSVVDDKFTGYFYVATAWTTMLLQGSKVIFTLWQLWARSELAYPNSSWMEAVGYI